ncbi:hypothetical protein [Cohnella fermenti]|uniref:Uncharacterized protein n=1 Tax=Cohnella fermenti TaxID=2565925 RepID=A0A4S4BEP3_9BACL|nr:hypothetical protein [Cohnella fermenti]THF72475.1 hypothetical protein E6C55_32990 [Cohnella fermenti]
MKQIRNEVASISARPPTVEQIKYYEMLVNNDNWRDFIWKNCNGPYLPLLPPQFCKQVTPDNKFCNCCIGAWSIVISRTDPAGFIMVNLVGITKINTSGSIHYVEGYIYPNLNKIQILPANVMHIGCTE